MRAIALVAGLTACAAANPGFAHSSPGETVIAKGYIANVDERNSSFDVVAPDGGRTRHATPCPVLMVIRDQQDFSFREYQATWQDLRKISVSGRITAVAVDPNNPNKIIFDLTTR